MTGFFLLATAFLPIKFMMYSFLADLRARLSALIYCLRIIYIFECMILSLCESYWESMGIQIIRDLRGKDF